VQQIGFSARSSLGKASHLSFKEQSSAAVRPNIDSSPEIGEKSGLYENKETKSCVGFEDIFGMF